MVSDDVGGSSKPPAAFVSPQRSKEISTGRYLLGMWQATMFSATYFLAPAYMIGSVVCLVCQYPSLEGSCWISLPLLLSILSKPVQSRTLVGWLSPMVDYFDFETAFEFSDEELRKKVNEEKMKYIVASQPHGVLSFCGMCAACACDEDIRQVHTAAASALMQTPILKNVMGIFGLVDASKASLTNHFANKTGIPGCLVLYVGGIAELFKSSRKEERLFLSKRKGFIKMALRTENVDILPAYLFGNTSVLSVWKFPPLVNLSRQLQVSLTYIWGKFYLPIPRDDKCVYARAKPMGLPYIPEPTDEDVNKWHAKYCDEVRRLFEKYKEKLPAYKHKQLFID